MLLQFRFKNFKSFKDEAILDMSATRMNELQNHVIEKGDEKVLISAGIFGANASGKSNIFKAFEYMNNYVLTSLQFEKNMLNGLQPTPIVPSFAFDNISSDEPTEFEVYFILPDDPKEKTYNYGFSILNGQIQEEWLNVKSKTSLDFSKVFYRKKESIKFFTTELKSNNVNMIEKLLQPSILMLTLGYKLELSIFSNVFLFFLFNQCVDFANPDSIITNTYDVVPMHFYDDENVRKSVTKFINAFDKTICGFDVEKLANNRYAIYTKHKINGSNEIKRINMNLESAGTMKMFALYGRLHLIFEKGGVMFIDELNSRLHPLLVRLFVISFYDKTINKKGAQIIFTSHDLWQLDSDQLRRDEIWFTEKNEETQTSELFSLADFKQENGNKIKKDENYVKNYLLGKYGAIPNLGGLFETQTENDDE